jgi:hypothetical protein
MALYIPIISEFNSKGIDKAVKEFKSLETTSQKAQFAIKKAALPAAAALAGVGAALFDATKGAIEDAAAQDLLANQLKKSTGATDAQIASVEKFVTAMGKTRAVADDEVRPALAQLVRATGDVTRAQTLFKTAQDISASTGKDLSGVVMALSKAEQGQYAALKKLGIPMGDNTRALMDQATESKKAMKAQAAYNEALASGDTKDIAKKLEALKEAQAKLNAVTVPGADYIKDLDKAFGGAGEKAAKTAAGGMKSLKISLDEAKESIGAALLPAVNKLLPVLQGFGQWAQDNTTTFLVIAGAITGIAVAVTAANAAMTAWKAITVITTALNSALATSFTAVQVASGLIVFTAIIAGLIIAYNKFAWFRDGVAAVFDFLKSAIGVWVDGIKFQFQVVYSVFKVLFNGIASLWNNTVGKMSFTIPGWVPGIGGKGFNVPDIPMLADGGIVTGPTLAMIGEAGPEAVIPLNRAGGIGGTNVTIHVNGGDPNAVVAALRTYMRQNGSVPIKISNAY